MRDGVTLRANVYRPEGEGPWPTLLMRTPYGKDVPSEVAWPGIEPVQTARHGFLVVVQDTRGRFASEGEWLPFQHERQDGHDTVGWAAGLPGSNGRVGMYGGSYVGNTQWLAAMERPPSLAAIAPTFTWSEPLDGVFARGGAVELGMGLIWALLTGLDHVGRLGLGEAEVRRRREAIVGEWDRLPAAGCWTLPVAEGELLGRHGVRDIGGIAAAEDPEVARHSRVAYELVEVPAFHTAGWYDIYLQGTLDNHEATARAGRESRLVVGPWTHLQFGDPVGELTFGLHGGRDAAGWPELQLAWYRRHLVPDAAVELPDAPVRFFVMGRNRWRDETSWPPARASSERWYLRSGGGLTATGPAAGEQPSEYLYDPADPVPTVGGHVSVLPGYLAGPRDQATIEARSDVLVFSSEPLRDELEVTGRVRLVLHAESSAPSTDWVARLCDVHPDGRSFNLCDGILRASGGVDRYEVDLWSTSNVFLPGHRLRVHVTSSSFPRWDRNLNTGNQRGTRLEVARQRVSHSAERPSYVELPVLR